jgi:E3 ubiquitin-protein ligase RAD18
VDVSSTPPAVKTTSIAYTQPSAMKQKERLPTLAYSMLTDQALRKKLKELGISNQGPKLLMQKRHTEWVNLWNANCDSRNPRSKRDLLNELEIWDRTQGRQIANNVGPNGVMAKDFDSDAYVKNNKNDFDDLIRKAREKANAKKLETEKPAPGVDASNQQDKASGDASRDSVEMVPESPVQGTNGYVDLTSSMKRGTQELQHRSSQHQNIAT